MKESIREEEILKIIKEYGKVSRLKLAEIFGLTSARISKVTKILLEKNFEFITLFFNGIFNSTPSTVGAVPSVTNVSPKLLHKTKNFTLVRNV